MLFFILIPIFLLAWGLSWNAKYRKVLHACKKYEFEHRTQGGVVEFPSFEESERFTRNKRLAENRVSVGQFFIAVGGMMLMAMLLLVFNR